MNQERRTKHMRFHQSFLSALLLAAAALPAAVSFESEVKPIFEKHCVECHGPKKQKSEFRLDGDGGGQRRGGEQQGREESLMKTHVLGSSSLVHFLADQDAFA